MSEQTRIPPSASFVKVMALDAQTPGGDSRIVALIFCDEAGNAYAAATLHPMAAASFASALIHETDLAMNGTGPLPVAHALAVN